MGKKPVTRKDIAELCEVSISVVSRALNENANPPAMLGRIV